MWTTGEELYGNEARLYDGPPPTRGFDLDEMFNPGNLEAPGVGPLGDPGGGIPGNIGDLIESGVHSEGGDANTEDACNGTFGGPSGSYENDSEAVEQDEESLGKTLWTSFRRSPFGLGRTAAQAASKVISIINARTERINGHIDCATK